MRDAAQRSFDSAVGAICILLLALSLFAGCSPDVVGVSGDEHDHEAEHHVPHYFPKDAVAAIARLQALCGPNATHDHGHDHGHKHRRDVTPRQEVYDLARWLPELAAETELDEAAWNQVRDASRTLERAADSTTGDAAPTGAEVAAAVQVLARMPQAIQDAEVAYRLKRGMDPPPELVIDEAAVTDPSTEGPDS